MEVQCLTIAPFCDGMFVITDNWQNKFSNLQRTKTQAQSPNVQHALRLI